MTLMTDQQTNPGRSRPGEPRHHLLTGALALGAVVLVLAVLWYVWGERLGLPCISAACGDQTGSDTAGLQNFDELPAAVALPPVPAELPEPPPLPDAEIETDVTLEQE